MKDKLIRGVIEPRKFMGGDVLYSAIPDLLSVLLCLSTWICLTDVSLESSNGSLLSTKHFKIVGDTFGLYSMILML